MTPNPRILILKSDMTAKGGLETWTQRFARAFSDKGYLVTLVTRTADPSYLDHPLIEFKTIGMQPGFSFQRHLKFDQEAIAFARRAKADIVLGMDRTTKQTHLRAGGGVHRAFLAKRFLFESRLKALSFSLNPLHQTILDLEKKGFENPNLKTLFVNSQMVKKEILHFYATPEEKIQVIPNGVLWNEWDKSFTLWLEKKAQVAAHYALDPSAFHFLFIGNGYRRKGLSFLLDALTRLPSKDFQLTVIGKDKNPTFWQHYVKARGLCAHVRFMGCVSDTIPFYQLADVLVIPSIYDPFANVTVEALAMGLTVISSPFNGGSEVLTPETGCILPSLTDQEAFAHALLKAMEKPKIWHRSEKIRQSIKHLDSSCILKQYLTTMCL